VQEFSELDPLESLQSPLSGVGNNGNSNLLQDLSHHLVTLAAQLEDGHANVYRPGRDLMDVDEEYKPGTLHNPSQLEMQTRGLVAPGYSHQSQASAQSGHQSHHNTRHMSAQGGSFFNDNDSEKSDEGEQAHDSHHPIKRYDAAPFPPRSAEVFPRWVDRQAGNASNGERGQFEGLRGIASHQNNSMVPQQTIGASVAHRASADSGYVSNTNSIQSTGVGYLHSSPPASNLINTLNQGPNGQDLAYQKIALHSISCPENHQGMGFNYHCCGSSYLQELALLAVNMLPEQVYQYLYNYMLWEGMRLYDHAGNTFLHKLAITGASWEYFKAAFKARINPCHQNAYGQTFAHVLNISAFHDNLIECLSSLRELGVDFGLRDASGRTILHCLYSQPMSPHTAREILKLIEEPGRQLSLRDVYGQTPCEIFKHTFLQQVSTNPRWSTTEPQLQMLGFFENIVDESPANRGKNIPNDKLDFYNQANSASTMKSGTGRGMAQDNTRESDPSPIQKLRSFGGTDNLTTSPNLPRSRSSISFSLKDDPPHVPGAYYEPLTEPLVRPQGTIRRVKKCSKNIIKERSKYLQFSSSREAPSAVFKDTKLTGDVIAGYDKAREDRGDDTKNPTAQSFNQEIPIRFELGSLASEENDHDIADDSFHSQKVMGDKEMDELISSMRQSIL
jgi:hypothetical protein